MGSGLLTVIILAMLSTCSTNGLSLSDLYPYGTEHGDGMRTGSSVPAAPLLAPIDNLVAFGPVGIRATRYRVRVEGYMQIQNDGSDSLLLLILSSASGAYFNNKVYGRTTDDPGLINRAMDQINEGFPNTFCSTSLPTQLIIGTWIDYLKTGQ
ncbi:PREDICTED: uncharacterized protein LOC109585607 isoform X2 [Amphimedon queenslandica]|uniref:NIDO domain-containing protein n=1 Tax=Amphimedon queenslandica TaxID=400682 RepID=A0AAN0JJU8_AMPQE|nr:PREDICTED: uncharacterized protein LOC109585607 isoform X2 [Amphimedon queenslandica]XP_019857295.1 PREDICTED: uncharacterized protein LOC109585607 isoform X2 [Amphimedon queenslandica]|eukprot:XP_019857294.1 PREDICTED: uncharacterized protein LOC109585607 isoform X2 [Amphimedon queenslandica]